MIEFFWNTYQVYEFSNINKRRLGGRRWGPIKNGRGGLEKFPTLSIVRHINLGVFFIFIFTQDSLFSAYCTVIWNSSEIIKANTYLSIMYNQVEVMNTKTYRYLGVDLTSSLNLSTYFDRCYKRASARLHLLNRIRSNRTLSAAKTIYMSMIVPTLLIVAY